MVFTTNTKDQINAADWIVSPVKQGTKEKLAMPPLAYISPAQIKQEVKVQYGENLKQRSISGGYTTQTVVQQKNLYRRIKRQDLREVFYAVHHPTVFDFNFEEEPSLSDVRKAEKEIRRSKIELFLKESISTLERIKTLEAGDEEKRMVEVIIKLYFCLGKTMLKVKEWLFSPHLDLANRTPVSYLIDGKITAIEFLAHAIESGQPG